MTQDTRRNPPDRVHIVNVRAKGSDYYVVLSDGSEVEWTVWCIDKTITLE